MRIKNIITGVLSGAVLFMAVQIGVAQEQVLAAADKVEVKESVEAMVLAGTVQKLNAKWAQNKAENSFAKIEVMKEPIKKEPVVKDRVSVLAEAWFDIEVTDLLNQDDPENQQIEAMLGGNPEAPCNDEEGTLCAVRISYDTADPQAQALISRIGTPNPPTVADFENLDEPATAIDHSYNDQQ